MSVCPSEGEVTVQSLLTGRCNIITSTVLVRRAALLEAGMFDASMRRSEDFDLWLRLAKNGANMAYQRRILALRRIHPESLSADSVKMFDAGLSVLNNFSERHDLTPDEESALEQARSRLSANRELTMGKLKLSEGAYQAAENSIRGANEFLHSWRLKSFLVGLRYFPDLFAALYKFRTQLHWKRTKRRNNPRQSGSSRTAGSMKIIVIAYAFPPFPVVGSFRAGNVVEAFRDAGHSVEVITVRLRGESDSIRVAEPDYRVRAVRAIPGPLQLYRKLKKRFVSKGAGQDSSSSREEYGPNPLALASQVPWWKRYILSALGVPDTQQGFIPPALGAALRAARGGADLIYTTAPPFSSHLVGLALKILTGTRWVAEFRDPWTDNPARLSHLRSKGADAVNRWLERRCIYGADQIVTVSYPVYERLREMLNHDERDQVILVRNGIDQISDPDGESEPGPFQIVYTGGIYPTYDPRPFLRGLAAFRCDQGLGSEDIQVRFVGRCRWFGDISLEKMVQRLGVEDLVEFREWVPQPICNELCRDADLLLLLAQGRPGQIPNKLYDYLGLRKPILAFATDDSESARMLRRVGGHYIVTDNDPESAKSGLEAAFRDRNIEDADRYDEALLEQWSTERQMKHLRIALGV